MNSKELQDRLKRLEDEKEGLESLQKEICDSIDPVPFKNQTVEKRIDAIDMDILACLTAIESAKQREARVPRHKSGHKKIKPDHIGNN